MVYRTVHKTQTVSPSTNYFTSLCLRSLSYKLVLIILVSFIKHFEDYRQK